MSSDTSSSPNASNVRPRRRGILGGLGRAVKLAKRPPQVNDSAGDESDECSDSELCELSSSNETSDTTDAESNRYTLYSVFIEYCPSVSKGLIITSCIVAWCIFLLASVCMSVCHMITLKDIDLKNSLVCKVQLPKVYMSRSLGEGQGPTSIQSMLTAGPPMI